MNFHVFHTVNSGLYFYDDEYGILIDALHQMEDGFSSTLTDFFNRLMTRSDIFAKPIDLLFTHLHSHNFSPVHVRQVMEAFPETNIYAPGLLETTMHEKFVRMGVVQLAFSQFAITPFSTKHYGMVHEDVPHTAYCLNMNGHQHFVCGDALLDSTLASKVLYACPGNFDAVYLTVSQLSTNDGEAFLKMLRPRRIFLYQLPFPVDDVHGYTHTASNIATCQSARLRVPVTILHPCSQFLFEAERYI